MKELDEIKVHVRFKLSALWAAVMFCYVYGDYFSFYVPKKMEGFLNGTTLLNTPVKLLAASILMAIPSLMVFLSLALRPKLGRVLNIIFGLFYSAIMILIAVTSISSWWAFYVFLAVVESCVTLLIVWYAWKWPLSDKATQLYS